ncbi:unnamed protein product [Heligmosomoides polygyrus]|uniref:Uncharacterized protein n=1 Tax=Heligmosomoides polygyrus TaxID=6339 RepID=A0A183FTA2_HELPZ|nr:unnamed protein product [Heligmosomoides polygyrus]
MPISQWNKQRIIAEYSEYSRRAGVAAVGLTTKYTMNESACCSVQQTPQRRRREAVLPQPRQPYNIPLTLLGREEF